MEPMRIDNKDNAIACPQCENGLMFYSETFRKFKRPNVNISDVYICDKCSYILKERKKQND
jgi:DNA-directed RNA polymerase subunit RPC12/RpoP